MGALWGALAGGGIALIGTYLAGRRQVRAADVAAKRESYLELLTWFSRSRDELRRTVEAQAEWSGDYSTLADQARMDALTELLGSDDFRAETAKWRPAFHASLLAYNLWLNARDNPARTDEVMAALGAKQEARQAELREVLMAIQGQARRDIADEPSLRRSLRQLRQCLG